jgi:hypothetical protein
MSPIVTIAACVLIAIGYVVLAAHYVQEARAIRHGSGNPAIAAPEQSSLAGPLPNAANVVGADGARKSSVVVTPVDRTQTHRGG